MENFRLLTTHDIHNYYKVLHEGYQSDKPYPISFTAIEATEEDALQWLKVNPTYGWFRNNILVSAISLRMPWGPEPGDGKVPHIGWFVTDPKYQHQGYAGKLLKAIEAEVLIKQLKVPSVTLGTAENHPWLVKMYEAWGFVIYDVRQLPHKKHRTVFLKKKLDI